jgi:hypothetical protein
MVVNLLVLFIVIGGIIISVAVQRDKLADPVFRNAFIFELSLYLAVVAAVLVIASQLFGPYIHWVPGLLTLIAIPFANGLPKLPQDLERER